MKRNKDILEKQQNNIEAFEAKINGAIQVVTNIIKSLENNNTEIEGSLAEISEYKSGLDEAASKLESEKKVNNKLISNFKSLIEVE